MMSEGWFVAAGFEPVAEAFQTNFVDDGEIGASFAAFSGGMPIVDIWGGIADSHSGRSWSADTMQIAFSGTKGLVRDVPTSSDRPWVVGPRGAGCPVLAGVRRPG